MNDFEWFSEHAAYLATPEWEARRSRVMSRDRFECMAKLDVCTGQATQVHHLTYKHWRNEPLFDLVSVCAPCHEVITEMDRASRPTRSFAKPEPVAIDVDVSNDPMSSRLRALLRGPSL